MTIEDSTISEREREVLILVANGASNPEIAAQLHISPNTVKVHLRNIYAKIGVVSRAEATLYAVRAGLIHVERARPAAEPEPPIAPETVLEPEPVLVALPSATPTPLVRPTLPSDQHITLSRRQLFGLIGGFGVVVAILVGLLLWNSLRQASSATGSPTSDPANPSEVLPATLPTYGDRWQSISSLPEPLAGFGLAQVTLEGRPYLYVIGGDGGATRRYDPSNNVWSSFSPKPTAVDGIQAVVVGNRLFVPGGRTPDGTLSDQLEVYDPQRDQWVLLAPLPAPRSDYALAAWEGKIYLFGGWGERGFSDQVFRYSPDEDRWDELSPMNLARGNAAVTVIGDAILVIGGEDERGPLSLVQRYSPAAEETGNPWSVRASLPSPRSRAAIATINELSFLLGGTGSALFIYNATNDSWSEALNTPLPAGLRDLRATALGNRLLIFGGQTFDGISAEAYSYQAVFTVLLVPPSP